MLLFIWVLFVTQEATMSNNKQSSVEKMFQEMLGIQQEGIKLTFDENLDLLHKYKAMHKEETLKLYYAYEDYVLREEGIIKTFGQFYNETFGGNK
jgi:hypothetical protein